MSAVFMGSALRALALALAVWAGLRVFRVRNVLAEKAAWMVVLAAALLMPLVRPVISPLASRWPAATLILPSIALHPAALAAEPLPPVLVSSSLPAPVSSSFVPSGSEIEAPDAPAPAAAEPSDRITPPAIEDPVLSGAPSQVPFPPSPARRSLSLTACALLFYVAVAGILLFRLLYGLVAAWRIWRAAEPVPSPDSNCYPGLRMRRSRCVSSPVTIGSTIVLPAEYSKWNQQKLHIVLAHEYSHIRQGDFYLQLLAGLYAALVWFSPLGWWLKGKLSDLGEAISDRSGLEKAESRSSYAQVLLEFAAAPRPTLIGVAMARRSRLSRRIERLLNDSAFRQAFDGGRRTFLIALLIPAALFAATALVRVQAASQTTPQQNSPAETTGQSTPEAPPATAPGDAAAQDNKPAQPQSKPAPGQNSAQPAPRSIDIPAINVDVPAIHVDVPAVHTDVPAVHVDVPAVHTDVPATHVDIPAMHLNVPAVHVDVPPVHVHIPARHIDLPAPQTTASLAPLDPPGGMFPMLSGSGLMQESSSAAEATFDRTLNFSGKLDLSVKNGSGNIHLTRGTANQLHVHARVHSRYASDAAEVREIADHPPIQQTGNIVRIGGGTPRPGFNHHISIDYEIEAPADAALEVGSGSGNVTDEGVGQDAKLMTGSGNIKATGLQGGFKAGSGSGNVSIENSGNGDAKADTGSGNIEVRGVHGALNAGTGSGNIKVWGTPTSAWKLQTGSGNVEFTPENAPLTLDASAGSGSISTDHPLSAQISSNRHHLHGDLNGGGPLVRISTGSGDIRIH